MLVRDIYDEIKRVTGSCTQTANLEDLRRAVQLLANTAKFDPLIGYAEFSVDDGYYIALPREVKTILKLNINNNPAFRRSRFFEFTQNSPGTQDGDEVGWTWSDKLLSPIQDEQPLPGKLAYFVTDAGDVGKVCRVVGKDGAGTRVSATLTSVLVGGDPVESEDIFAKVDSVSRDETNYPAQLHVHQDLDDPLAIYDGDDTAPSYRVIKVSKTNVDIRIMFRRPVLKFTSLDDIIPLSDEMAVIHAVNAVVKFRKSEYAQGKDALALAVEFLANEQRATDEGEEIATGSEIPTAINTGINARDSIIVADVYDDASQIFGPIGQVKLFDKITMAIESLRNKTHWDSGVGVVDLWPPDRSEAVNYESGTGTGYYVLPRFVETVLAINVCGNQQMPRNRWFEFHLNTFKAGSRSPSGTFDDAGETPVIARLSIDGDPRCTRPAKLVAIPESADDNDTEVRVFGTELVDNMVVEVVRDGVKGWVVPCEFGGEDPGDDAPSFISITRITKAASTDFIRLYSLTDAGELDVLLGYWYPDEVEPRYRAIKLATAKDSRLTIMFRRRFSKITSLYEPIPLNSRLAIIIMMRALKIMETDMIAGEQMEILATKRLAEARINDHPSDVPVLQFAPGSMPGDFQSIQ